MQTQIGKLLVAVAIIVWVLGGIAGVALGIANAGYREDVNFLTMVLYWVIFFIVGALYYGFAVLVDRVICLRDESSKNLSNILSSVKQIASVMEAKAAAPQPAVAAMPVQPAVPPYAAAAPVQPTVPQPTIVTAPVQPAVPQPAAAAAPVQPAVPQPVHPETTDKAPAPQQDAPAPANVAAPMAGQMFCPNCGKQQSEKRDTCYWCGARFIR